MTIHWYDIFAIRKPTPCHLPHVAYEPSDTLFGDRIHGI